ncbi:hypothetical protein [Nostoc sp.]|uniref:hypothetical protein n=1 Tax=Nostoc sp. TaxID=1180 RepID=UPI002FF75E5D
MTYLPRTSDRPDPSLEQVMKKAMHRGEPIFLYRCGGRVSPPPTGYYWRMMKEHPLIGFIS